jgi:CRISPR-associated protein Cst2
MIKRSYKMGKFINGFVLIDTPHSALNNAGMDASDRTGNIVRVKKIRRGKNVYPYVSGQAWKYWWRKSLENKFGWKLSPIEREKKSAFTEANPFEYKDDDVFGYMRAQKSSTLTRLAPLKVSLLVSAINQAPTEDFGVMARHEGDAVPFEHEIYSTILKGIFSLDIELVGRFYSRNKTGYHNVDEKKIKDEYKKLKTDLNGDEVYSLPDDERKKRIKETIGVLPYINGGAMQSTHLTDVSPKLIVMALTDSGNNIFMNLVNEKDREIDFSFDGLNEVLKDYKDSLLSKVYVGKRTGFLDELSDGLNKADVVYTSPKESIEQFLKEIDNKI